MSSIGSTIRSATLAAMCGGALLVTAGLGTALAQPAPPPGSDGLVNVVVAGNTVLDSVPDGQAAQAVADMCALSPSAMTAMASQVDAAGGSAVACAGRTGDVSLVQNLPAAQEPSPIVPGTSASFGSGEGVSEPAGPDPISSSLPTDPDNISDMN